MNGKHFMIYCKNMIHLAGFDLRGGGRGQLRRYSQFTDQLLHQTAHA